MDRKRNEEKQKVRYSEMVVIITASVNTRFGCRCECRWIYSCGYK